MVLAFCGVVSSLGLRLSQDNSARAWTASDEPVRSSASDCGIVRSWPASARAFSSTLASGDCMRVRTRVQAIPDSASNSYSSVWQSRPPLARVTSAYNKLVCSPASSDFVSKSTSKPRPSDLTKARRKEVIVDSIETRSAAL